MKTVLAVLVILSLAATSAFAASTTGFGSFVTTGNVTATATTMTTGYYNGGDAFYAAGSAGDFSATFTVQARNINGGFAWTVGWYVDAANRNAGQNYNLGGYSVLSSYGASAGNPAGSYLPYQWNGGLLGGSSGIGPAMYAVGNIDGPSATFTLSCIGGVATMVSGATTLFQSNTPNTGGFSGFNFLGDGTYTVSDFSYTDLSQPVPEPCSMLVLGVGALLAIRRRK